MKKRFDRSGTARRKAVTAVAALTMALVLAVGGAGAATLLSAQPETLTVGAVVPHITAEAPQASSPAAVDPAPVTESTAAAPEQTAESTAQPQQAESVPEQAEKPETAEIAPAAPEEAAAVPETPVQPAGDAALEEENSPAMLLEETPELAAQDPQAPAADSSLEIGLEGRGKKRFAESSWVNRINYDENGRFLGEFNDDDSILVVLDNGEFYITNFDVTESLSDIS